MKKRKNDFSLLKKIYYKIELVSERRQYLIMSNVITMFLSSSLDSIPSGIHFISFKLNKKIQKLSKYGFLVIYNCC